MLTIGIYMTTIPLVIFLIFAFFLVGRNLFYTLTDQMNQPEWVAYTVLCLVAAFLIGIVMVVHGGRGRFQGFENSEQDDAGNAK